MYFRPDAVPLVDAFAFHDESLGTAIGTYDGHAYERLLLAAQDSELNKADVSRISCKSVGMIFWYCNEIVRVVLIHGILFITTCC